MIISIHTFSFNHLYKTEKKQILDVELWLLQKLALTISGTGGGEGRGGIGGQLESLNNAAGNLFT